VRQPDALALSSYTADGLAICSVVHNGSALIKHECKVIPANQSLSHGKKLVNHKVPLMADARSEASNTDSC